MTAAALRAYEDRQANGTHIIPLPVIPVFSPFMAACDAIGLHRPTAEFRFHPQRRWRWDFAWPLELIAVEIQGGIWTKGRHSRGKGQLGDMEKMNAGVLLGWRIFYFTPDQFDDAVRTVRLMLIEWKRDGM